MYISKLSIRNYRNFRNVSLVFKKGVNTIIGENGSGKTNLFQAMRILIDESMPRVTRFYDTDFNRSIGPWAGHWITIQLEFSELDLSEEAQALAIHRIGNIDEPHPTVGTYAVFFRPKIDIRRDLFKLSKEIEDDLLGEIEPYREKLNGVLSNISLNDYETIFTGKGNADFSKENTYKEYIGDFELIKFPDPDEEKSDIYGVRMTGISIPNEFACTFAKALRDVEAELRSFKDNPLINLLRDKEKKIEIEQKKQIESKVEDLNESIANLDEVKGVSIGISETVKEAVGETYAPNVNIKSELPSEMEKLLQSLKLWVGDPDEEGHEGRLWELSLGGANLIYLSLKLLEFEKVKKEDKIANFILIEEPEAHIHNHIQKTLFQKLNKDNTQVFITTHSTHISSVCQISSMNILGRGNQLAEVFNPSNGLEKDEITKLERYLDASRTNLLFAKGVMLVEGDAEHILIPALVKVVLGVSLDELGVSLINIGSTGFSNIATLFHDDRVHRKCSIITDSDISFYKLPAIPSDAEIKYDEKCKASEKSGKKRKEKLDAFCQGNKWINPFYASHTFEVDFLIRGNAFEIIKVVEKQYDRNPDKESIIEKLENKDVSISGKEVLRLAEKFGKGWFAIMISEEIDHLTYIPEYILQAIAFASPKLSLSLQSTIANYRLQKLINNTYNGDKEDYIGLLEEIETKETHQKAIELYLKRLPHDAFTKLIKLTNA
jgi:predicted ATP-dependent endonuclease of OLD family